MPARTERTRIYNFSFGEVTPTGIHFEWKSSVLSELLRCDARFQAAMFNDSQCFAQETEWAAYHSVASKQELGHNPRSAAQTGWLKVSYEDFDADLTYRVVEHGNIYLHEIVAPILSFLQRRRILFGKVPFSSSQRLVIAMPPFLAGEWVDSVAFGPEAISTSDLQEALRTALAAQEVMDEEKRNRAKMLLARHNEILNLPYIHERVESLWRIIEAIGRVVPKSEQADAEYQRLLRVCQIRRSENLELLIRALTHYHLTYSDDEVQDSRSFRNQVMHEFLDPRLQSWPSLTGIFYFLQRCVDRIIADELGLSTIKFQDAGYAVIQNRVI